MADDLYDPDFYINKIKRERLEKGYAAGKRNLLAYHERQKAEREAKAAKPKPPKVRTARYRPIMTITGLRSTAIHGSIGNHNANNAYRVRVIREMLDRIDLSAFTTVELCEMIKAAIKLEKPANLSKVKP